MSGHSKWHQIKRKKEATDTKRGQAFTRLAIQIKQATRTGNDPATNPALVEAIARAKRANMPQANIDRLLSEADSKQDQAVTYEAFGPNGVALLIITRTDNSRRTVAELRNILKSHGGTLGNPGSVLWKFEHNGDQYTAKYTQPLANDAQDKLSSLLRALDNHPDIGQIFTDAVR